MTRDGQALSDYESVTPTGRGNGPRAEDSFAASGRARESRDADRLGGARRYESELWHDAAETSETTADAAEVASAPVARDAQGRPAATAGRGHFVSFVGLFLFTAFVFFRPYELLSLGWLARGAEVLAIFTLLAYVPAQLSVEGNLTSRPREVTLTLLLLVAALVSVPLAISPGEAWDKLLDFSKVVLMFVVVANAVRTEWRLHALFLLTLGVSCVLGFGALNDFRQGRFAVEEYRVAGVIGGMFGNPNDMALHLATMVPLALALLLAARGVLVKLLYGACALLFAAGIVVTFSRGGFLGLAAAFGFFAWKAGKRHRLAVAALTLAIVAALLVLAPGSYGERLTSIVDFAKDPMGSASMRQQLFWRSLFVSLRNPVFGVGVGNFHHVSVREQETHNAYTQVTAEAGLAAGAIYVLLLAAAYKTLRRVERGAAAAGAVGSGGRKRRSRSYYLAVGLQASLVGYAVSSFFASVAYHWYLYYLVGYAVALARIYPTAAPEDKDEARAARRSGAREEARTLDDFAGAHRSSSSAAV